MYLFGWGLDKTMLLLLPAIIFAGYAQMKVQSAFNKYSQVRTTRGVTGAMVARAILDSKGLNRVAVEMTRGRLTDHYDPRTRTVRLSPQVYQGTSLASLGVAAHETGHAIQHATGYVPLTIRHAIVPVAQLGNWAAWPLLLLGFMFGALNLINLGIAFFSAAVLFQIITLPVEFNASSRAMTLLANGGYISREEMSGTKKVLDAAAMTYVAAALMSIMQLVRLLILARVGGDDN